MTFLYEASHYQTYRPQYPASLFAFLKDLAGNGGTVLDCGAGSGQSTVGLANCFENIIATDLSYELLSKAPILPNVYYVQSAAERFLIFRIFRIRS